VGRLPSPGCYLVPLTTEVQKLLVYDLARAEFALSSPAVREPLAREVEAQIEGVVEHAMTTSRRTRPAAWLRHYWLPGASDIEVENVAVHALDDPRDTSSNFRVDPDVCPALAGVLRLRHDTSFHIEQGRRQLRMKHALLAAAVSVAIEEGWQRGLLSNDDRRVLLKSMPLRSTPKDSDEWVTYHWWTGKGDGLRLPTHRRFARRANEFHKAKRCWAIGPPRAEAGRNDGRSR
jgi:hypothetical protein